METGPKLMPRSADWVDRAHGLAVEIIHLSMTLPSNPAGWVLSKQVIRSATSIVANLEEARGAMTLPDTLHKTVLARKEARETWRWLLLLRDGGLVRPEVAEPLINEADQIIAMLTAGTKKLQRRITEGPR